MIKLLFGELFKSLRQVSIIVTVFERELCVGLGVVHFFPDMTGKHFDFLHALSSFSSA
nr:MAG TPA: hypothetical protein [Caudoviricetes sp.]